MNPLFIVNTAETPNIHFEPQSNKFVIEGKSLPENALEFYEPVFEWLEEYASEPNTQSVFDIKLEYFNTASAKQLGKVLLLLKKVSERGAVLVRWHYEHEDASILNSGKRYEKLIKLDFEYVSY